MTVREEIDQDVLEGLKSAVQLQGKVLDRLVGDLHRLEELQADTERRLKILEDRREGRS